MARDWIELLADLAREQERSVSDDPRFDALVEGSLSDAEKQRLTRDAEASLDSQRALAACLPFDDSVKVRLVERARTELSSPSGNVRDPIGVADDLMGDETKRPMDRRTSRSRWPIVALLVFAFAASAGLAAYLARPSAHPTMASYELTVMAPGSPSAQRGVVTVSPQKHLLLTLRPTSEGARATELSVFLEDAANPSGSPAAWTKLDTTVAFDPDGATRIEIPHALLTSPSVGQPTIVVVAVRQGPVPTSAAELEEVLSRGDGQVFRQGIQAARTD